MDRTVRDDSDTATELEPIDDSAEGSERPANQNILVSSSFIRTLARSFELSPAPYAIIDFNLRFLYRNPRFRALLASYEYEERDSLPATFARTLSSEAAADMRSALLDPTKGHLWKGTLAHKAKDAPVHLTKMHIQPLWLSGTRQLNPDAFFAYLDDITEENKGHLRGMFSSLLEASKMKDNDTGRHIERVNLYSSRLARELYRDPNWPEVDVDFIEDIAFLAAMHDVGKIGTPDDILNKNGPLSEFEWSIMKEHTINGAFILSSYPNPMAKQISLSHHEWWNGSGYPYKLDGKMIPLAARIVTIADVYDALRMKRSYKPSYSHEVAREKMRDERGIHFDPSLVDVFLGVEEDFSQIFSENADETDKPE